MEGMNIGFRWPIFDFNSVKVILPADCADLRRMFGVAAGNYSKYYLISTCHLGKTLSKVPRNARIWMQIRKFLPLGA